MSRGFCEHAKESSHAPRYTTQAWRWEYWLLRPTFWILFRPWYAKITNFRPVFQFVKSLKFHFCNSLETFSGERFCILNSVDTIFRTRSLVCIKNQLKRPQDAKISVFVAPPVYIIYFETPAYISDYFSIKSDFYLLSIKKIIYFLFHFSL